MNTNTHKPTFAGRHSESEAPGFPSLVLFQRATVLAPPPPLAAAPPPHRGLLKHVGVEERGDGFPPPEAYRRLRRTAASSSVRLLRGLSPKRSTGSCKNKKINKKSPPVAATRAISEQLQIDYPPPHTHTHPLTSPQQQSAQFSRGLLISGALHG